MATTMNGLVREALLDAARNIIRRGSIHDLTIAGMAAEANYARPTAYRYFSHPRDVVYEIAETTMTKLFKSLDFESEDFAADYARAAVREFTSDPLVNRQVLLYAGVQSTEDAWLPGAIHPESVLAKQGFDSDSFIVALTYFRGAMYSWAAGFFTDEQFAAETERALSMRAAE